MTNIIGIDTGVQHLGLAVYSVNLKEFLYLNEYNAKSYANLRKFIVDLFSFYKISNIIYEKPFFTPVTLPNNIRTLEIIGIIKLVAEELNIPVHHLSPATIKKQITGNGRAKKEDIMQALVRRFKDKEYDWNKSSHISDAAAVAISWYELAPESLKTQYNLSN